MAKYAIQSAKLDLVFLESRVDDLWRSYYDEIHAGNKRAIAKRICTLKVRIERKRELISQLNSL